MESNFMQFMQDLWNSGKPDDHSRNTRRNLAMTQTPTSSVQGWDTSLQATGCTRCRLNWGTNDGQFAPVLPFASTLNVVVSPATALRIAAIFQLHCLADGLHKTWQHVPQKVSVAPNSEAISIFSFLGDWVIGLLKTWTSWQVVLAVSIDPDGAEVTHVQLASFAEQTLVLGAIGSRWAEDNPDSDAVLCSVISTDKRNQTFEYVLNTFSGLCLPGGFVCSSRSCVPTELLGNLKPQCIELPGAVAAGDSGFDGGSHDWGITNWWHFHQSAWISDSQTLRLRGNRRVLVSLLRSEVMTFENCKIYSHALLRGRTQQALTQMSGFSSARCCRLPLVGVAVWHGVQWLYSTQRQLVLCGFCSYSPECCFFFWCPRPFGFDLFLFCPSC